MYFHAELIIASPDKNMQSFCLQGGARTTNGYKKKL